VADRWHGDEIEFGEIAQFRYVEKIVVFEFQRNETQKRLGYVKKFAKNRYLKQYKLLIAFVLRLLPADVY
jgi:hypothetical protein